MLRLWVVGENDSDDGNVRETLRRLEKTKIRWIERNVPADVAVRQPYYSILVSNTGACFF